MAIITIIGSGMMGSAMAFPACKNGNTIRLVGSPLDRAIIEHGQKTHEHLTLTHDVNGVKTSFMMPEKVTFHYYEELDECMKGADLLICGISSFGLQWFCENVVPRIPEELPVLSITKGMIDNGENKGYLISYPEYMLKFTDKKLKINAVGGPCTSYELADLDPTEVTFCGPDMELLRWIRSLFETDFYHVSLSTDIRGVECAVALKNAYALGVSLAIGLSYKREGRVFEHYNSQAALFGQAAKEMYRLLDLCDGNAEKNIFLGVGDLYVTVFGGRTRKIGTLLGEGKKFDEAMEILKGVTLESIVIARRTADAVIQMVEAGRAKAEDFPLLYHIRELLVDNADVNVPWSKFEVETIRK
ncbi:MAG: glycerol-3-phosphate dehydrogenase [Ruminococcaceae bacterium]|nr:glycerol-3-phosphate dehydrogenase [Oscillospiraceae bacterium]